MPTITEVTDLEALQSLRDIWSELLVQTPGADFFRTLDWLETYWCHFGADKELRILTVQERGATCGIVPLVVRPYASKIGRFRTLSFPLDSWGSFYGPIGAESEQLLQLTLDYLKSARRSWDYVDLRWIAPTTENSRTLKARHDGTTVARRDTETAVVEMTAPWQDYWSSRSSNWRSNCRRNLKKLKDLGEVEHVRYRPEANVGAAEAARWDLYDECIAIAQNSWQGRSTNGTTLTHDSVRAFLRDLHARAAASGCLDLNLLRVNGEAVAFNSNYVYGGYVSSLRLGFKPEFRQYCAGTVLTYLMLEDSFRRGDHTFDFLPGSPEVKRPWQTHLHTALRLESFPLQFGRVGMMHARRWLTQSAERAKQWWHARSVAQLGPGGC